MASFNIHIENISGPILEKSKILDAEICSLKFLFFFKLDIGLGYCFLQWPLLGPGCRTCILFSHWKHASHLLPSTELTNETPQPLVEDMEFFHVSTRGGRAEAVLWLSTFEIHTLSFKNFSICQKLLYNLNHGNSPEEKQNCSSWTHRSLSF